MIYYRRYMGSYQKRTTRLSMRDHGAYTLMLDFYYAEEEPLPLEIEDIHDICKARTPDDRKSVEKVLRLHFEKREDGYHNARADGELATSQQARENGKGHKSKKTGEATGSVTDTPTGEVTKTGTGEATGEATETITGRGGGSVHPSTYSLSTVQPYSLPTDQPSTDSPAENRSANPPPNRAAALAVLVRNLEKERGKHPKITSIHPLVQGWVKQGVTDEQLREAYQLAVADRDTNADESPLNAGFLDVFLAKILNPPGSATTRVNGQGKPWFIDSWPAIAAKGAEKGLKEADFDSAPAFRAAVLKAFDVTADDVRKAELEWKNAA